jgi:succinate dehydrogenase/fumarate reductase flavoprotein subunit
MFDCSVHETDVLVIGGGAGARAAIAANDIGAKVVLVDKGVFGKAGITQLSFGIVCAYIEPPDSADVLFEDMVRAGEFLNNQKLVEIFAKEIADGKILELEGKYGFVFDRTEDGKLVRKKMGGHSYARDLVVTWNDAPCIWRGVIGDFTKRGIPVYNEVMITDLLTFNGRCVGALGLDIQTGDFIIFKAKSTVLATGGLGQIYKITDNSRGSTGDGFAMAYRAGAELRDMEYMQTMLGFAWPRALRGIGIGEPALTGGKLFNVKGERFMMKVDPINIDNVPKDIHGRAVMREVREGRGTEHGGVYFDLTRMGVEKQPHYHYLYPLAANVGLDLGKEYAETVPVEHYFMGGVYINENHESSVPGLFAAGEVASGLHGAERLAGCSVADITVFGYRAGKMAAESAMKLSEPKIDWEQITAFKQRTIDLLKRKVPVKGIRPVAIKNMIRELMWEYVHLLRDENGLKIALEKLRRIREEYLPRMEIASNSFRWNYDWIEGLETINMIDVAEMITRSALARTETRGAHAREDYPKKDDENWLKNIVIKCVNGEMKLATRPVVITKLKPGE